MSSLSHLRVYRVILSGGGLPGLAADAPPLQVNPLPRRRPLTPDCGEAPALILQVGGLQGWGLCCPVCRCWSPESRGWGGSFLGQDLLRIRPPPAPSAERGSGRCDISCQPRQASRRQLMPHSCLYQRRCRKRRKWRRGRKCVHPQKALKR